MENRNVAEPLLERAEEYGRTSYELFKLKALDKTTDVVSTFVSRGASVLVFTMFTIMANIGIAMWLGDILGKSYYGFFCISGFYGIIAVILYFVLHDDIKKRISNSIISQFFNK
jgi:hypothetical protein